MAFIGNCKSNPNFVPPQREGCPNVESVVLIWDDRGVA